MNVYIGGTFNVTKNRCELSIMHFQSCDILLHGKIIFSKNNCGQVILLNTYIKVMEYTNVTFNGNTYKNNVISIKENTEHYSQPYPFCFIQYTAVNDNVIIKPKDLLSHYSQGRIQDFLKGGSESGVDIEGGANPSIVSLKQGVWGAQPPRSYGVFNFG